MVLEIDLVLQAPFSETCGADRLRIGLRESDATLGSLLGLLSERTGGAIDPLIYETGSRRVQAGLMVMLNDQLFTGTALNQNAVPLGDGDRVTLMYFVSGG